MNFLKIIGVLSILLIPSNVLADSNILANHETKPQQSGQICRQRAVIIENLSSEAYQETPKLVGIMVDGKTILEIWSNKTKGNWSALVTQADGTSCLVAIGSTLLIISKENQIGQKVNLK